MRYLYLVRHGKVQFDDDIRKCIGRTDLPLSREGKKQAYELGEYFSHLAIDHVLCSPLIRSIETAQILSGNRTVDIYEGLIELDMGEWENQPLKEIKKELESEPIEGEKRADGLKRFQKTIDQILKQTDGNIVCVCHAGINSCFLADLLGISIDIARLLPQPYGCINRIKVDNQQLQIEELGRMPRDYPSYEQCLEIYQHYHTPDNVIQHCLKVRDQALYIAKQLNAAGCHLCLELIESAALLHDVVRYKHQHPLEGAKVVIREGYPLLADIIRQHHDIDTIEFKDRDPREVEVVYLADKYIQGDKQVTLDERFERSLIKCQGDLEAQKAHQYRYQQAKYIERYIMERINKGA